MKLKIGKIRARKLKEENTRESIETLNLGLRLGASLKEFPVLNDFVQYLLKSGDALHNSLRDTVENFIVSSYNSSYGSKSFSMVPRKVAENLIKESVVISASEEPESFFGFYEDAFIDIWVTGDHREVRVFGEITGVNKVCDKLEKILKNVSRDRACFKLLTVQYGELAFSSFKVKKHDIEPEILYGKDFLPHNKKIIELLKTKDSGIYMFRGPAGTGKTTYIKYLAEATGRTVLFVPEGLVERLVSPEIVPLLLEYRGSILVIEDAERAIAARDGGFSPVSALLNLSDGIMGDVLNIATIVTYNTDISNIDKALTRKGRCLYDYEFNLLSIEDGKILAQKLGKNPDKVDKKMSLGEIANLEEENNVSEKTEKPKPRIGF